MGCIETMDDVIDYYGFVTINNNMGCIETYKTSQELHLRFPDK